MRKIFLIITAVLCLCGCQTIQFGPEETVDSITEKIESDTITQYNLTYRNYLGKSIISTGKSVPEDIFFHPDGITTFIIVSFPKIGILKTVDNGETFSQKFFDLPSLNTHFGYNNEIDESARENAEKKEKIPDYNRIIADFKVSPNDENKIFITMGDYIFVSQDKGDSWKHKKIFYDNKNTKILSALVTKTDKLIAFANNKVATSDDWGKKWKSRFLKFPNRSIFNLGFVDAVVGENDEIYICVVDTKIDAGQYSKNSFDFFYNNCEIVANQPCVYYSTDDANSWNSTKINVPAAFFQNDGKTHICPVYPCDLYKYEFSEKFKADQLYKKAKLTEIKKIYTEYLDYLGDSNPDNLTILSPTQNSLAVIDKDCFDFVKNPDFKTIFSGMLKLQNLYFTQFIYKYFDEETTNNFQYEFSRLRTFKKWTAMKTNNPVLYTKDGDTYYRMTVEPNFWKVFGKYAFENQQKINTVNPFLKKISDIEFINPQIDKTGFPVVLQKSTDGTNWTNFGDNSHIYTVIDPLSNKRSGYYWYKNVEQKKNFKLQFSFGSQSGINYMQYPIKFIAHNGELYILLNYFTFVNVYKDLYVIKEK